MLNAIETVILDMCKKASREKPVSIKEIKEVTMLPDNTIRKHVADLRGYGYRICSQAKGYWVAKNESDYLSFRGKYMAEISKRIDRLKAMDNTVLNQIEMGAEC